MKPITYDFFKTSKQLRKDVKEDLMHEWKECNKVSFVTRFLPRLAIILTIALLITSYFYWNWYTALNAKAWEELDKLSLLQVIFNWLVFTVKAKFWFYLILVILVFVDIPLKYGAQCYFLKSAHNNDALEFSDAFIGFKNYFKVLGIEFQRHWLTLVGLLPVILVLIFPDMKKLGTLYTILMIIAGILIFFGLLRGLRTTITIHISYDKPDLKVDEIFVECKKLMYGRLIAYILLMLSMIPYHLLGIITIFTLSSRAISCSESAKAFFYIDLL